jgi:glycine/serine hydroxymethyltransferase
MGVAEMELIAQLIAETLKNPDDQSMQEKVLKQVQDLCRKYPIYGNRLTTVG